MVTRKERVWYELTASDNASRVFKKVEDSSRSMAMAWRFVGGAALAFASSQAVRQIGRELLDTEREMNRLTAVLHATGGALGITRDELLQMAEDLQGVSLFDAGEINLAQAELVKFGNIHGQIFKDALKASADLASFMGSDVAAAAQMVGRAVQSPTEGLRLLERQFGRLTEAEEDHIQKLAESGRAVEAQRAVLDLLERKVGGTAELMNTGLTAATENVSKAWEDMLTAFGQTEAVQTGMSRGLDILTNQMRALRRIVEGGNWLELLMGSTMAGVLSPQRLNVASGRIRNMGLEDAAALEAGLSATPAVPITLGGRTGASGKSEAQKAAEARLKLLADIEKSDVANIIAAETKAYAQFGEVLDQFSIDALKAEQAWTEFQGELHQRDAAQMVSDQAAAWGDLNRIIDGTSDVFDNIAEAQRRAINVGQELGWAFSSFFENAIIEGGKVRDMFQGMAKDVLRIVLRQQVTQPMATALAGAFSGMFGGARAEGGPVSSGRAYLVGERGAELFMPGQSGQIIPNGAGGVTITQHLHFSANTPAASRDAVYAAAPALIESAKRAVFEAMRRGS